MQPTIQSFAKAHPSIILTLSYALITAIGTGYSFLFYQAFDINILKFADLSDFLLAAILEPRTLALFGFAVLLLLVAYGLDVYFRKRFEAYRNFVENRLKSKYTDPITMFIVALLCTVVLMQDLAKENADSIKKQGHDSYQVAFGESESLKTFELLGSTSRFVYLYDRKAKQSLVVSPENISFMQKQVKETPSEPKTPPIEDGTKQAD